MTDDNDTDDDTDGDADDAGSSSNKLMKAEARELAAGFKKGLQELTAPLFQRYQADQELKARELDLKQKALEMDSSLEHRELEARLEAKKLQHERKLAQVAAEKQQRLFNFLGFIALLLLAGLAIIFKDNEAARLIIVAVVSGGAGIAIGEQRATKKALAAQNAPRPE